MKKILILVLTILILNSSRAAELNKEELLNKCIQNISKLQTLLEYYYIEFGNYPYNLKEMEKVYNKKIDPKERKITIPLDPATGKEFIYQNSNNSY
ncbi:MAG: hypothetical protein HYU63_05460, partial [Armatimonadetes bacterium]|nr:hypothetical protein [Armatimonadota bacterium]